MTADRSMSALERAARAMWDADSSPSDHWETATEDQRQCYFDMATAALRALREPDEAMIKRWADEWGDHADVCADSWGGTIDSILAGQPAKEGR